MKKNPERADKMWRDVKLLVLKMVLIFFALIFVFCAMMIFLISKIFPAALLPWIEWWAQNKHKFSPRLGQLFLMWGCVLIIWGVGRHLVFHFKILKLKNYETHELKYSLIMGTIMLISGAILKAGQYFLGW